MESDSELQLSQMQGSDLVLCSAELCPNPEYLPGAVSSEEAAFSPM